MIALIDQDLLCYRCAASAENESEEVAIARLNELLDQILTKTKATEYRAFLTGTGSYRKAIYPEYKANRTQPKPKWLQLLREHSISTLNAEVTEDGLEADDMLGIIQATTPPNDEDLREEIVVQTNTVICSLDKDLLQIPGLHFQWGISGPNWVKEDTYIKQTPLEGKRLFYKQCLKGDPSDNIKGIEGIGEKKASKMLSDCKTEEDMFKVVRDAYGNDEEFIMNARCLYIMQHLEDDFLHHFERMANGN